jgi:hypothetical protein
MSATWDDAEEQPSILGEEVRGQCGARQAGDTSTTEDGLAGGAGVGTRVEGPSAGGGEIAKGIGPRSVTKEHEGDVEGINLRAKENN